VELLHGRDEQAVALRRQLARALQEFRAVHVRHAVVGPDDDELSAISQQIHGVGGLLRGDDFEPFQLEGALQGSQDEWLVVDEEQAVHDTIVIDRIAGTLSAERSTFPYSVPASRSPAPSPIHTVFTLTNSRRPTAESSRPCPLALMPPKGRRGSDLTIPLMKTCPACSSSVRRRTSAASRVHAAAPRPNFVALASSIASDASRTLK